MTITATFAIEEVYYSARYYNPATGRFLSRDPEDGQPIDPKTLHKYLYAGGDPVNALDPMGREDFVEFARKVVKFLVAVPVIEEVAVEGALCLLATGVELNALVDGRGTDAIDILGVLVPCELYLLKTALYLQFVAF
jgi:RHS repeat-associated protein